MATDTNIPSNERRALEDENRDCPHCGGSGMCLAFHPRHDGTRDITVTDSRGRVHKIATEVAAHCTCPVGVWIRERTEPALQRRIPWVRDIHEDRSKWLMRPPSERAADDSEVPNEHHQPPTRAAIARQFGKIPQPF
jgi:hypothetical protein